MVARYAVRNVDMGTGERMPLLVDISTGLGVFEATAYSLTLRSCGRQANTLTQAISSIAFLYETLAEVGVDLMDRARNDDLLSLDEVESLVARCKYSKSQLWFANEVASTANVSPPRKTLTKSKGIHCDVKAVKRGTAAVRLYYIAKYLEWFATYAFLLRIPKNRNEFRGISALVISAIKGRAPKSSSSEKTRKKGITKIQEQRLLAVVDPISPENPWHRTFVRNRNYVIVRLLRDLGIRKGELLGVKIEDIDFGQNTLFIARRPNDPEDLRNRQPESKTLERTLPMGDDLATILRRYIDEDRFYTGNARQNPFLIVGSYGEPLALNSVDYMFSTLREKFPELIPVAAHLLRHTWNDAFSEFAKGTLEQATEQKIRNYLMGWSDNSKMAANYTARFVEEEGREASLTMQNAIFKKVNA